MPLTAGHLLALYVIIYTQFLNHLHAWKMVEAMVRLYRTMYEMNKKEKGSLYMVNYVEVNELYVLMQVVYRI